MITPTGFDPEFLSSRLDLPRPRDGRPVRELPYTHFTVLLDPARRLAVATGVNIDGSTLRDLDRGDDWHFDERVPESEQTGPEVYASNDLDRGHQVRRRDPVWGDNATASAANFDTFSFTNAAPQAAEFNQSEELWAGLEDYVLGHARTARDRLSVFTAPVLAADDPVYRGVRLPRMFWKIAAWSPATDTDGSASDGSASAGNATDGNAPAGNATVRSAFVGSATDDGNATAGNAAAGSSALAATGYILDQSPELGGIDLDTARTVAAASGAVPPLGPFKTYQVPIADIAALTGLDLDAFVAVDRFHADDVEPSPVADLRTHWHLLESMEQLQL